MSLETSLGKGKTTFKPTLSTMRGTSAVWTKLCKRLPYEGASDFVEMARHVIAAGHMDTCYTRSCSFPIAFISWGPCKKECRILKTI